MKKIISRYKPALSLVLAFIMLAGIFQVGILPAAASEEPDIAFTQAIWPGFKNPPLETKSMPLWFWNEEIKDMDDNMLREMVVQSFEDSGYYGFGILPNWIQDYMTEDYFHKYEVVLEACYELGMSLSLYDENGYPSYAAGGILEKRYPELTAKRLDKVEQSVTATAGNRTVTLNLPAGAFMGAVAMNTTTLERTNISSFANIVPPGDVGTGAYASSIYSETYNAAKAFNGLSGDTDRWNSQSGQRVNQWIEVRYENPVEVDRVDITEHLNRIGSCAIQVWDGEKYVEVATAESIGGGLENQTRSFTFSRVTTTRVRFHVYNTRVANDPTVTHMRVFNNGVQLPVPPQRLPVNSTLTWTAPTGAAWRVMAFMCVRDGTWGMDYLDREAVARFIEITHQAYYERFPEYFPKGDLPGTGTKPVFEFSFYDEPSFTYITQGASQSSYGVQGSRAWTPKFNEEFFEQKGYDPVLYYPALWYDIGELTTQARKDLYSVRTELFSSGYIGQVNKWCEDHGIELTGHMLTEERHNPVPNCGDLMKAFKHQAIPGVDVVGSYASSQEAYKIISSSAYNWDKGRIMVECYGAMGEGMGKDMLYRQAMDLYAKGINHMVPHAIWSKMSNVIHPPELSYRNPNYASELWKYNEYIGRLQQMLWDGRHVADIAVLYPIDYLESVFTFTDTTSTSSGTPSDSNYMTVGEVLAVNLRRDFTFLHPEVIDERCVVREGGTLFLDNEVNFEEYKVFVLPGTQVISLSNAQKIQAFFEAGGSVIAVGQLPYRGIKPSENSSVAAIMSGIFGVSNLQSSASATARNSNANGGIALKIASGTAAQLNTRIGEALTDALAVYDVKIDVSGTSGSGCLTYIHKVKEDTDIYFLSNSTLNPVSGTIDLRGEIEPYFWDPHTGARTSADYTIETIAGEKVTRVRFSLPAIRSIFIVDDDLKSREIQGIEAGSDIDRIGIGEFVDLSGYKKTAKLSVEAIDITGERIPVPYPQIDFESMNPGVAVVDAFGAVTGVSVGTATIKVSFNGYETFISIPVETITVATIKLEPDTTLLKTGSAGSAAYLTVTGLLSDGGQTDVTKMAGFSINTSPPGLLAVAGVKVQRASGAPDSFSALLDASLTIGETKISSNSILFRALPLKNVALSANGGTATASGTNSASRFSPAFTINGVRTGRTWDSSAAGWNSQSMNAFPVWLEVAFSERKLIDEISVYNLQDNYANGVDPDPWMTFRLYGLADFEVQYHNGAGFVPVPGGVFEDNNLVWNRILFDPVETNRIRVYVRLGLQGYARVIEFEAWEADTLAVDKSKLLETYSRCKDLDVEDYTDESWLPFKTALDHAVDVLLDGSAAQGSVDSADADLKAAAQGLVITTRYALTVTNGSGSGRFKAGRIVDIAASEPIEGFRFIKWVVSGVSLTEEQLASPAITLSMPANEVELRAVFIPFQGSLIVTSTVDKVSAKVDKYYVNETTQPVNAMLLLALYDGAGKLLSVESITVTIPAKSYRQVEIGPLDHSGADKAKAFLWDADTYVPLLPSSP